LQEIFDEKEEIRRTKVAELQERLAKQQEEADARARDRDEIIARRKAELLGQQDRFDW
jgi:DNA-binding TFAR19-related protein (PDSD5 family)